MKKFKKVLKSFFLCLMCGVTAFLSACAGGMIDDLEGEDLEYAQIGFLDNVKVLRRSYGTDKATAISTQNAYLEEYSQNISQYIIDVYGLFNQTTKTETGFDIFEALLRKKETIGNDSQPITPVVYSDNVAEKLEELNADFVKNEDYFKYFFDATRYQISVKLITYYQKSGAEDGVRTTKVEEAKTEGGNPIVLHQEYQVVADTSLGWNWGVKNSVTSQNIDTFMNAYLNMYALGKEENDEIINIFSIKELEDYFNLSYINLYYTGALDIDLGDFRATDYTKHYYDTNAATDFEKALSYAIYAIINKDDPTGKVRAEKKDTGTKYTVAGYEDEFDGDDLIESSVEKALKAQRQKYEDNASYVGVSDQDKKNIIKFILSDVIGENAVNFSNSAEAMQDLYYEELVEAVVTYCTTLTKTGEWVQYTELDEEVINGEKAVGDMKFPASTLGGAYMSSEIVDYEFNTAYINGQNEGIAEFEHLGEYEYQSMLLMPKDATKIDEIILDFGYLGDYVGANDWITIKTYVRHYLGGGRMNVYEQNITVKETSLTENNVDPGEDGTTLMFDFAQLITDGDKYLEIDKINFDRNIATPMYALRHYGNAFLPEVTDPRKVVFGPMQPARNFYSLIQGNYRDYGVFDFNTLKGVRYDQKYVEIAFEVQSISNKERPNYKFLCGITWITEVEDPDLSGFK